jgi:DNA-binding winged helix-turn-helix (wHTH) protein/Tfp pilus assembly protein PilF
MLQGRPAVFYDFGPFRLDESARVVLRGNDVIPLAVKAFEILYQLIKNRGSVVSKDILMRSVWPDCFVEENNLSQNISALRRALSDDPEHPKYIETIPRRGYRFVAAIREINPVPARRPLNKEGATGIKSLAVLPFQSIGATPSSEFLNVGLADALITKLSNIDQIEVRPTASILGYANAQPGWVQAGAELSVDALIGGCIQQAGEKIRVTVQLIAASDGRTLWAGQFDEAFTDIFTVEDSISQQVTRTLMLRLTSEERRRLSHRHTSSPEAHTAYLKGRHFWNRRTEADLHRSIRCFQEAVDHDPSYALAYAGLADSYTVLGGYSGLHPTEAYPRARAAALRALEIDPNIAEAHTSLGDVFMYYDWRAAESEAEYRKAIELRPDYATAHHFYTWYLMAQRRFDEADAEMRRAVELDPLSPMINTTVGFPAYFARDFERAISHLRKALEMDPYFSLAHTYLGRALLYSGNHARAVEVLRKAVELSEGASLMVAALGNALALTGQASEARELAHALITLRERRYVSAYYIGTIFAGLSDSNESFRWLDLAYKERVNQMVLLPLDPAWDQIRSDPRFDILATRVGFAHPRAH